MQNLAPCLVGMMAPGQSSRSRHMSPPPKKQQALNPWGRIHKLLITGLPSCSKSTCGMCRIRSKHAHLEKGKYKIAKGQVWVLHLLICEPGLPKRSNQNTRAGNIWQGRVSQETCRAWRNGSSNLETEGPGRRRKPTKIVLCGRCVFSSECLTRSPEQPGLVQDNPQNIDAWGNLPVLSGQ